MLRSKWLGVLAGFLSAASCLAQSTAKSGELNIAHASGSEADKKPTEITATKSALFDGKSQTAVFVGDVKVRDSQFDLSCEKLTAYLRNQGSEGGAGSQKGGLDRVIAEGNVVIIQERAGEKTTEAKRYVAKAAKAEYDTNTQDLKLSGWPQVQEGINMHIGTSEATVMYLSRSGKLRTEGLNKTVLQEQVSEKKERQ